MKLVYKHIYRELMGPFLFGVAAFTSVAFAIGQLQKLTQWVLEGMSIWTAIQVVLLILPSIVVYTLPMATLLAVLMGLGRLCGDSEIVALFAGGVSFKRIMVPVIILGVIVSAFAVTLNEVVAPWGSNRSEELKRAVLKQTEVSAKPFSVQDSATGSQISVRGGMDVETGTLRDVTIVKFQKTKSMENGVEVVHRRPIFIVYAPRAQWEGLQEGSSHWGWRFYDGFASEIGTDSSARVDFKNFKTGEVQISKNPDQLSLYQKEPEQMSFVEMTKLVRYISSQPDRTMEEIRELDVARWNKLALPLSSMVFAMLAAPLAIRPQRSSSSVGLGMSILLIFAYWVFWRYTSAMAVQGTLLPVVGAFAADVVGVIVSIILLRKVST